jgi:hypothetical protein
MVQASMPFLGRTTALPPNGLKKNIFSKGFLPSTLFVLLIFTGAPVAFANAEDPGDRQLSLSARQTPEYDPLGIRLGDFILSPNLSTGVSYTDNVYATDLNRVHDFVFTTTPTVRLQSDFVRHSLNAGLFLERGLYQDVSAENYTDYGADIGGRFDISGQTTLPLGLSYKRDHIRRGSPDDTNTTKPTFFQLWDATTGLYHEGRQVAARITGRLQRLIYDSIDGPSGKIDNSDRDHNEYTLYSSVGMNSDAMVAPFVYGSVLKIDYDRERDDNNQKRNAMQYEAGIGTIVNLSDITTASFTLGRLHRTTDDPNLNGISDFTYGVNLKWEPSTLASFLLSGDRTVKETTLAGVTGSVESALKLSMQYELFRNLILNPSIGFVDHDYRGPAGGRTLDNNAGLQLTYKMNRNFWLTASYQYTNRDVKEPAPDLRGYDSNSYGVSLKLQF